ncbi:glycoside hydrolase family 3 protein [Fulvivirga lutimaris]|uniref:glycoside hydrolase family 3 protein n=1 Tax=Fulvivirga lutimaris TaxID=1819566 RepID=UPI0012BC983A|nr:glycoside hydrolase family 3 protein [Fulvivirga lutimaris]MTI41971.1 glycoside hydrolase family 3 protein [Fulvivirga lutimaris]
MSTVKYFISTIALSFIISFLIVGCSEKKNEAPAAEKSSNMVNPEEWRAIKPLPLDPAIEAQIDEILPKLTLEQKVGQVIQADSESITPEEVKKYRIGSVLSGGNSAPGPLSYSDTKSWLEMADKYYNASIDDEGVEVAIPSIWGIDAVHGHANLKGAIIFPHNVGLGAMNNPDLIEQIAAVTAHELTVSGHDWTFAPTLALPQDTRWGRSYEGFSEDTTIVKAYAPRVVYGLQGHLGEADFMGDGRVISSAKHFLADGATEKGVDQGDALISEAELRNIHAAGYYGAIPAGVQTVMASFSSWQGRKLHGDKELLTDVLKGRLGFNGFVVGDWNGHGQVEGCTNTDCPQAINAGLDMYMAPDSWRGLYESTLKHVKSGTIPMARLDDAVRRILRVKLASGIFTKGAPSTRKNAGDESQLGLPKNRAIARQAVRESLVLVKNNNGVLPIDPSKTILVVGDGAESISKACGGWTLSWQGTGHTNDEFPNGMSILDGIKEAVDAAGGKVIYSANADANVAADVVIAVYGEDPYAEFQGDRENLDFVPNGFDVNTLAAFKEKGIPVVSVFLSGRPLWTNPEINNSEAFIAAWLPGSEGGGISDMLFQRDPSYDFKGRLSFSWPSTAVASADAEPLFKLGYGLSYKDQSTIDPLSEDSGIDNSAAVSTGEFFIKGAPVAPWEIWLRSGDLNKQIASFPSSVGGLIVSKTDHQAQEDALRLKWTKADQNQLQISASSTSDMARQANGAMELAFFAKSFAANSVVQIGVCNPDTDCNLTLDINIEATDWREYRISLSCFANLGVDMTNISSAFMIKAGEGTDIGLSNIRLGSDLDAKPGCDGN